jgi:hypothetical protein
MKKIITGLVFVLALVSLAGCHHWVGYHGGYYRDGMQYQYGGRHRDGGYYPGDRYHQGRDYYRGDRYDRDRYRYRH